MYQNNIYSQNSKDFRQFENSIFWLGNQRAESFLILKWQALHGFINMWFQSNGSMRRKILVHLVKKKHILDNSQICDSNQMAPWERKILVHLVKEKHILDKLSTQSPKLLSTHQNNVPIYACKSNAS